MAYCRHPRERKRICIPIEPRAYLSREIHVDLDGDTIKHVDFVGGCDGNLKAIGKLVNGKNIGDVATVLEGNTCGRRSTSCADQPCPRAARGPSSAISAGR